MVQLVVEHRRDEKIKIKMKGGHSRKKTQATNLKKLESTMGMDKVRFLHKSKHPKVN